MIYDERTCRTVPSGHIQRLTSMERAEARRGYRGILSVPKRYLMIFGGPPANESKRERSPATREVNIAASQAKAAPVYLKWSEAAITFDRTNRSNQIQQPGRFPLVISVIVGRMHLTKVLMDDGSGLNVLYAQTYDAMGLSQTAI